VGGVGGILQGFMFPFDLGRLGNAIAWWLGQEPYELFFYVFLPPLLFDSAVRIDYFIFLRVCPCTHVPIFWYCLLFSGWGEAGLRIQVVMHMPGLLQVGNDCPIVTQTSGCNL
jgi:hypothetical protein